MSPFGHPVPLEVFCDVSLRAYDVVYPAGGSRRSAVRTTPAQLGELTGDRWVDVMRSPAPSSPGQAATEPAGSASSGSVNRSAGGET